MKTNFTSVKSTSGFYRNIRMDSDGKGIKADTQYGSFFSILADLFSYEYNKFNCLTTYRHTTPSATIKPVSHNATSPSLYLAGSWPAHQYTSPPPHHSDPRKDD